MIDNLNPCPFCNATPEEIKAVSSAIMSLLFYECQPDNGHVFGFCDDIKEKIAEAAIDAANKELRDKLHKYGCTLASIYSLVKPLAETNGVHGAIAECIETYTPLAAERQIKS